MPAEHGLVAEVRSRKRNRNNGNLTPGDRSHARYAVPFGRVDRCRLSYATVAVGLSLSLRAFTFGSGAESVPEFLEEFKTFDQSINLTLLTPVINKCLPSVVVY